MNSPCRTSSFICLDYSCFYFQLYFKLGNTNAGLAYKKAVGSLKELPIEVTVENAKSLGKSGRNKVKNIGLGSANKLHEFLATGTIEKLEQLRHDAAA